MDVKIPICSTKVPGSFTLQVPPAVILQYSNSSQRKEIRKQFPNNE